MSTNNQSHQTTRPAEALDIMTRLLQSMLDSWRSYVDQFLVQLDLAHMEIRDKVAGHEELPQQRSAATWRSGSLHFVIPSRNSERPLSASSTTFLRLHRPAGRGEWHEKP